MTDDAELLRQYADDHVETAFAELVHRHVDLVYSSALRQSWGDHHRAQEVTQMVFTTLARKAAFLIGHPVLPAWLHRSSHLAALELRRKEHRRLKYEKAAGEEVAGQGQPCETAAWEGVSPLLDDAVDRLNERDRQAILLRYFANRTFAEIGERLNLSENAARMRVERALAKLHALLVKGGIRSTSAALIASLSSQAIVAAPAGVAAASASAALAAGGGGGLAWIAFMSSIKIPVSITAAILVSGAAVIALQENSGRQTAAALTDLARQNQSIPELREKNQRLLAAANQARSLGGEDAAVRILQNQVNEAEAKAGAAALLQKVTRSAQLDANQPVVDMAKLDQRPVMISQHRPEYPPALRQAGAQGQAVVDFVVGSDGLVYGANAVSFTDPAFADSAVQAVSQWVFKPGQMGGQSVFTHMQVPIVFTLSADSPDPGSKSWF